MIANPIYVVITPVRNEAERISQTIQAMAEQTIVPQRWVIVDDGSTDETARIIDSAAVQYEWIRTVHRADRGKRKPGGGVVEAFYDGYPLVKDLPWQYLVKLDGDLSFAPDYFSRCFEHFDADDTLGIGGGDVCVADVGAAAKVESVGDPPFHVRGATKIYRRGCWEKISPLIPAPGWDTLDEIKANMLGWATRTFPDVQLLQLKTTGAADGSWRNWFKNGRGCYVTGYDPLFMFAKCLKRAFGAPPVIPGLALGAGYCSGYLRGMPRLEDPAVITYLRRQQRRRLFGRASIYG